MRQPTVYSDDFTRADHIANMIAEPRNQYLNVRRIIPRPHIRFSDIVIYEIRRLEFSWFGSFDSCGQIANKSHPKSPHFFNYIGRPRANDWRIDIPGWTWRSIRLKRGNIFVNLTKIEKKKLYHAFRLACTVQKIWHKERLALDKAEHDRKAEAAAQARWRI